MNPSLDTHLISSDWPSLRTQVLSAWGKLTDADIVEIAGERRTLFAKIQQRYGRSQEDIINEIARFERSLHDAAHTTVS